MVWVFDLERFRFRDKESWGVREGCVILGANLGALLLLCPSFGGFYVDKRAAF